MRFHSSFFFQITSGALSDMIDPSDRKTSEFPLVGRTIGNEIEGVYHSSKWPAESTSLQLCFFFFFQAPALHKKESQSRLEPKLSAENETTDSSQQREQL